MPQTSTYHEPTTPVPGSGLMPRRYLERALAQEESKLRIAEQVHREEGLELHLEMATRQRGEARADAKATLLQEEVM